MNEVFQSFQDKSASRKPFQRIDGVMAIQDELIDVKQIMKDLSQEASGLTERVSFGRSSHLLRIQKGISLVRDSMPPAPIPARWNGLLGKIEPILVKIIRKILFHSRRFVWKYVGQGNDVDHNVWWTLEHIGQFIDYQDQVLGDSFRRWENTLASLEGRIAKLEGKVSRTVDPQLPPHEGLQVSMVETLEQWRGYLKFFPKGELVLDLGCGRGRFLELLRNEEIAARGVDLNAENVAYARSRDLVVEQRDLLDYLEQVPDESIGGILLSRVWESLDSSVASTVLKRALRKLKTNGCLIVQVAFSANTQTTVAKALCEQIGFHEVSLLENAAVIARKK